MGREKDGPDRRPIGAGTDGRGGTSGHGGGAASCHDGKNSDPGSDGGQEKGIRSEEGEKYLVGGLFMDFKPSFHVHIAERLCFVDMPVIITTAYTNPGGYARGEWFLIIPEKEKHLFAERTSLGFREFPKEPVTFGEEFLLNELLNQAKLRLHQHIIENKGIEASALLAKHLDVLPSNQNLLVNLWMRGGYIECLKSIHDKTECEPLAEFIRLVFGLPKFSRQDI